MIIDHGHEAVAQASGGVSVRVIMRRHTRKPMRRAIDRWRNGQNHRRVASADGFWNRFLRHSDVDANHPRRSSGLGFIKNSNVPKRQTGRVDREDLSQQLPTSASGSFSPLYTV